MSKPIHENSSDSIRNSIKPISPELSTQASSSTTMESISSALNTASLHQQPFQPESGSRLTRRNQQQQSTLDESSRPRSASSFHDLHSHDMFVGDTEEDGEEEAPFQIHRKLLRRRHVRKEQLQKRRELARLVECRKQQQQQQVEHRKRGRVEGIPHPPAHLSQSPSPMEISTPERPNKECDSCHNMVSRPPSPASSTTTTAVRMVIGGPIPYPCSPGSSSSSLGLIITNSMNPSFSPVRPTKRRNIQFD